LMYRHGLRLGKNAHTNYYIFGGTSRHAGG
jgi:hypothetical protein